MNNRLLAAYVGFRPKADSRFVTAASRDHRAFQQAVRRFFRCLRRELHIDRVRPLDRDFACFGLNPARFIIDFVVVHER